jgi:hypothetical protein
LPHQKPQKILTAEFAKKLRKGRRERLDVLRAFASFAVKGFGFGEVVPDNIESRLTKR